MQTRKRKETKRKNNGSKWCRKSKRLAIIIFRDGGQCAYCGASVEDGVSLTLDHITPWVYFGSNKSSNLITACLSCNSKRQDRSVVEFLVSLGLDSKTIVAVLKYINTKRRVCIKGYRKEALELLKVRSIAAYTGN